MLTKLAVQFSRRKGYCANTYFRREIENRRKRFAVNLPPQLSILVENSWSFFKTSFLTFFKFLGFCRRTNALIIAAAFFISDSLSKDQQKINICAIVTTVFQIQEFERVTVIRHINEATALVIFHCVDPASTACSSRRKNLCLQAHL